MKPNKKLLGILAIIIAYIILLTDLICNEIFKSKIISWIFILIIVGYILGITYWIYKKEWKNILGLSMKNITGNVMLKSFAMGLLVMIGINLISKIILFIFKISIIDPYEDISLWSLVISAIILAPIFEELLFRGFIQGILQKNFLRDNKKNNIKIIICITSFLFALAHLQYIFKIGVVQSILSLLGIFIISLYLGKLRYKYNSIVPSIFAHLGYNSPILITAILMLVMSNLSPYYKEYYREMFNKKEYLSDTIFSFDLNDYEGHQLDINRYVAQNISKEHNYRQYAAKGTMYPLVNVCYDIDTLGFITNVRIDTLIYGGGKYSGAEIVEKEALRLIESLPQHKPLIVDGEKVATTRRALVRLK